MDTNQTAGGPDQEGRREIPVVRRVLDKNDAFADRTRALLADRRIFSINMMSSPGSGKTTLLTATLERLLRIHKTAVIVGDVSTTNDADRMAKTGAEVLQINTDAFGGDCHLGAHVVEEAVGRLHLDGVGCLIIENVGNLVCPAGFDIGEDARVVVLSTTEGEDKPLKYPVIFRDCDVAVLSKIDLIPYLDFDREETLKNIQTVHPGMPVFEVSSKTGEGLDQWVAWLSGKISGKRNG